MAQKSEWLKRKEQEAAEKAASALQAKEKQKVSTAAAKPGKKAPANKDAPSGGDDE
jgi:hypothetical protein